MSGVSDDDLGTGRRMDGILVGALGRDERDVLDRLVAAGRARWVYEGAAGFMGLARVKMMEPAPDAITKQEKE